MNARLNWTLLLLLGATAVAALLRLPFLGNQSIWYDETFTANLVSMKGISDLWHGIETLESTPPLYYLQTWLWIKIFGGHGEVALRLTSVLVSIASVPVAFLALRRFVGERSALATAWICAVSPWIIFYSLDARAYSLFVLTSLLSLWAFSLLLEGPTGKRWLIWAVVQVIALWTHYFAAFLIAGELLVLLWYLPMQRLRALLWSSIVAVGFLPLVGMLSEQMSDERAGLVATRDIGGRIESLIRHIAMGYNVPESLLEWAGLILFIFGFVAGVYILRRSRMAMALLLSAAIALVMPLLLDLLGIVDRFGDRYLIFLMPVAAAFASAGLIRAKSVPLIAYLTISAVAVLWVQADWRYQNEDWRGASKILGPKAAGQPIVLYPGGQAASASHYLKRPAATSPIRSRKLWVFVESMRTTGRELEPYVQLPIESFIDPGFRKVRELRYHGFRMIEFKSSKSITIDPRRYGATVFRDEYFTVLTPH